MPKKNRKSVEPVSLRDAPEHFHWRDGRDYVHEVDEMRVVEKTRRYMRQAMAAGGSEYFDAVRERYIRGAAIRIAQRESWKAFGDDVGNGILVLVGYLNTGDGRLWRIPKYVWTDPSAFEDWRKGRLSGCGLDFVNVGVLKPSEAKTVPEFCGAKEEQPERPEAARSIERSDRAPKGTPGRTPTWDWDAARREMMRLANSPDGLPEPQAEIEKHIAKWFVTKTRSHPAESTIRVFIGKNLPPDYRRR